MRGGSDAARRRCQGWPLGHREAARSVLYSVEHGVTLIRVGTARPTLGWLAAADAVCGRSPSDQRGTCGQSAIPRLTTLYSVGLQKAPTMMQSCASAAGSGAAAPIYKSGTEARVGIGAPPPRIVWATRNRPTAVRRQALRSHKSSLVGGTRVHGRRRPFRSPPASARRRPAVRRSSRSATARSGSCAPAPRSLSCGYRPGHRWCARDTIAPGRCPSGT